MASRLAYFAPTLRLVVALYPAFCPAALSTLSQKPQAQHFVPQTLMCLYYEAPLPTSRIRGEAQFILAPVPVVSPIAYRSTDYTSGDALAFTAPGMATDGTLTDGK